MSKQKITRRRLMGLLTGAMVSPAAMAETVTAMENAHGSARPSSMQAANLRCEYRHNPLGLDTIVPRFGWELRDANHKRGQRQTAYQVHVATRRDLLSQSKPDLWDSKRVVSYQSVAVPYAGKPLRAGDDCWWQVRVWDKDAQASAWSAPARFTVGLLTEANWQAQWIGMASASPDECPYFRKHFTLSSIPETALAYVSSIGYHELHVNGRRVGDGVLAPSVSNLQKRALYVTYDLHEYLRAGENVVALWVAPGWGQFQGVNPPVTFQIEKSALCIAQLQFGTPRNPHKDAPVVTDTSWRCALSTTKHVGKWTNANFGGDFVDPAKAIDKWNDVGLADSAWEAATVYKPGLLLSPDTASPNRRCQTIKVKTITALGSNRYRIEMAEIFTGWLELDVKAVPGTKIAVTTSSRPEIENEFNQRNEYVVGPTRAGVFSERFSYHQYHYVTLEGLTTPPTPEQITGYRIGNDLAPVGAFDCSNKLLKDIYDATVRTYVNLTTGGMTVDCPHRERLGYGGDGHTSLELALDTFDTHAYLTKWAQDFCDIQELNGNIYHTAPTMDGGGGPAWSGFVVTLPFEIYRSYNDRRILERTYPYAQRFLAFLKSHVGADGLLAPLPGRNALPGDVEWAFLGDWAAPNRSEGSNTPEALLFNNCYFVYILGIAAEVAMLLGKTTEATRYKAQADSLRQAIDKRFYNAATHTYLDTRETHCILPLLSGVVQGERIAQVQKTFENELLIAQKGHLDTGLHGTYFMTKYLTEHDRSDLVFTYATQTTFPGYGELLAKGYTTWPEYWGGSESKTHGCLNGIGGWFQRGLAGIRLDPQAPGYRHVLIKPALVGDLTWVAAHHDGPYGRIAVRWERHANNSLTLDVTIPPNSTADVYVPAKPGAAVTESGAPVAKASEIKLLRREADVNVYRVSSGNYKFAAS